MKPSKNYNIWRLYSPNLFFLCFRKMNQRTILLNQRSSEIDLRSSEMNQRTNLFFLCFKKIQRRCTDSTTQMY
jgi:hypothetical protein